MKRRTRLRNIGCAAVVCGTFFYASTGSVGARIVETEGQGPAVVPTSGAPPRVHAPTGRVTVGTETLTPIGTQTTLIPADQVLTIAPQAVVPTPPPPTPPPVSPPPPVVNDAGWHQVAICEEGGSNSPEFGYFGIMPSSWAAYGGTAYSPTAGGASWDTQVMIGDKINGGSAPWAPAGCAADGYNGW